MGPREVTRLRAASYGLPARLVGACAQVPVRYGPVPVVDRRFVAGAHRREVQVHVWTINDAEEMRQLLDLGVDGIMTDEPVVLKEVLQSRNQWA